MVDYSFFLSKKEVGSARLLYTVRPWNFFAGKQKKNPFRVDLLCNTPVHTRIEYVCMAP